MGVAAAPPAGFSATAYPADVTYAPGGLERSRLTVFFRSLLAIPSEVMVSIWGIGFYFTSILAWFAVMFTGKYPEGLYSFGVSYMRMNANFLAYLHFVTDEYPPWTGTDAKAASYPVQFSIVYPGTSNRLTVFFRSLLAIPAEIFAMFVFIGSYIALIIAWFAIMITGKYPESLLSFNQRAIRYYLRVGAYAGFMTDTYPPFSLS